MTAVTGVFRVLSVTDDDGLGSYVLAESPAVKNFITVFGVARSANGEKFLSGLEKGKMFRCTLEVDDATS